MPLGFTPEATTDYWIPNLAFIDYERHTERVLAELQGEYLFAVKEKVHMLGIRSPIFYERLRRIDGVVTIPPEVNSNQFIDRFSPVVLVGAGSAGVEATVRNKPVVTFCPTSYWYAPSHSIYVRGDSGAEIGTAIDEAKPAGVDAFSFVRDCLSTTLSFDCYAQGVDYSKYAHELSPFLEARPFLAARANSVSPMAFPIWQVWVFI